MGLEAGADVNGMGRHPRSMVPYFRKIQMLPINSVWFCQLDDFAIGPIIDIIRMLANRKADLNKQTITGETSLLMATAYANKNPSTLSAVKVLVDACASVNLSCFKGGTPLLAAAKFGYMEACRLLLQAAASVNSQDERGHSPLLLAIFAG